MDSSGLVDCKTLGSSGCGLLWFCEIMKMNNSQVVSLKHGWKTWNFIITPHKVRTLEIITLVTHSLQFRYVSHNVILNGKTTVCVFSQLSVSDTPRMASLKEQSM